MSAASYHGRATSHGSKLRPQFVLVMPGSKRMKTWWRNVFGANARQLFLNIAGCPARATYFTATLTSCWAGLYPPASSSLLSGCLRLWDSPPHCGSKCTDSNLVARPADRQATGVSHVIYDLPGCIELPILGLDIRLLFPVLLYRTIGDWARPLQGATKPLSACPGWADLW